MGKSIEELAEAIEAAIPPDVPEQRIQLPNGSIIQILRLKRPD